LKHNYNFLPEGPVDYDRILALTMTLYFSSGCCHSFVIQ
jgi:hypothetical protein